MIGTHVNTIKKIGLVSNIKLNKYNNLIYRSCMPNGTYDVNKEILNLWNTYKIETIFCMCPEEEFIRKTSNKQIDIYGNKYKYFNYPIINYNIPTDFNTLIDFLNNIKLNLDFNTKIVIHCSAGVGRTGLILTCFLMLLGYDKEQTKLIIENNINYQFINSKQITFANQFYDFIKQNNINFKE